MRKNKSKTEDTLADHVCKQLKPLILARISYIPRVPKADWRDLPNIVVKLPDDTKTEKLLVYYVLICLLIIECFLIE